MASEAPLPATLLLASTIVTRTTLPPAHHAAVAAKNYGVAGKRRAKLTKTAPTATTAAGRPTYPAAPSDTRPSLPATTSVGDVNHVNGAVLTGGDAEGGAGDAAGPQTDRCNRHVSDDFLSFSGRSNTSDGTGRGAARGARPSMEPSLTFSWSAFTNGTLAEGQQPIVGFQSIPQPAPTVPRSSHQAGTDSTRELVRKPGSEVHQIPQISEEVGRSATLHSDSSKLSKTPSLPTFPLAINMATATTTAHPPISCTNFAGSGRQISSQFSAETYDSTIALSSSSPHRQSIVLQPTPAQCVSPFASATFSNWSVGSEFPTTNTLPDASSVVYSSQLPSAEGGVQGSTVLVAVPSGGSYHFTSPGGSPHGLYQTPKLPTYASAGSTPLQHVVSHVDPASGAAPTTAGSPAYMLYSSPPTAQFTHPQTFYLNTLVHAANNPPAPPAYVHGGGPQYQPGAVPAAAVSAPSTPCLVKPNQALTNATGAAAAPPPYSGTAPAHLGVEAMRSASDSGTYGAPIHPATIFLTQAPGPDGNSPNVQSGDTQPQLIMMGVASNTSIPRKWTNVHGAMVDVLRYFPYAENGMAAPTTCITVACRGAVPGVTLVAAAVASEHVQQAVQSTPILQPPSGSGCGGGGGSRAVPQAAPPKSLNNVIYANLQRLEDGSGHRIVAAPTYPTVVVPVFIQMFPCELRERVGILNRVIAVTCGTGMGVVVNIEPRSETSFIATIRTSSVFVLIQAMRCRVLMDRHGFWYAEDMQMYLRLKAYCEDVRRLPQQTRHFQTDGLPCMPLVVELARSVDRQLIRAPAAPPCFDELVPLASVDRHRARAGQGGGPPGPTAEGGRGASEVLPPANPLQLVPPAEGHGPVMMTG